MDGVFLAGIIVVLAFAIIGLASAGIFLADKASGSSGAASKAVTHPTATANGVARANAEATSIVQTAQHAGSSIVKSSTSKAKRQAAAIIAAAQHKASTITPTSSTTTSGGSTSTGTGSATGTTGSATSTGTGTSLSLANPNSLPRSWLVVGYNATFGAGPGSAGGIAVVNRSGRTFSGVATVVYNTGGSASAPFSGLAPGQAEILPLNGRAYSGGGYRIVLSGFH
jgi:hypothetical protein